jgi:hypothetical protein
VGVGEWVGAAVGGLPGVGDGECDCPLGLGRPLADEVGVGWLVDPAPGALFCDDGESFRGLAAGTDVPFADAGEAEAENGTLNATGPALPG